MTPVSATATPVTPLSLADRLITLAQEADRAGLPGAATHLVTAMYAVLDTSRASRANRAARSGWIGPMRP